MGSFDWCASYLKIHEIQHLALQSKFKQIQFHSKKKGKAEKNVQQIPKINY
jgi:hypothetical protein